MLRASYRGRRRRASRPQKIAAVGATGAAMAVGMLGMAAPASAASTGTWDQLAQCESGGDWSANTGNGFYGGLQFSDSTWGAYGGDQYASTADQASKSEQIAVAERILSGQGWGAWPACSSELGLSGGGGDANAQPAYSSDDESESSSYSSSESTSSSSESGYSESSSSSSSSSSGSYSVESGDTLGTISDQYGVSWRDLYEANDDVISDPNMIYPGQELSIP